MYRMTPDKLLAHSILVRSALIKLTNLFSKNNVHRANQQADLCC